MSAAAQASAQDSPRTTFGGVGLIEMPSARFAPDGELSAGASFFDNTQRYHATFEMLPWLETGFHYSGLAHFEPGTSVYYDRSFSLKARLWNEDDWLPALAVGLDDVVGTGVYGGEYLVMSKQFGSIDASLGIGWGRLGSTGLFRNPLGQIFPDFRNRTTSFTTPGEADLGELFHGPTSSLFGGVVWQTPLRGLSVVAEYSSDDYTAEKLRGNFRPANQMNYGVSYQPVAWMTLGLDWLYGRTVAGSVSFHLNPSQPQYPKETPPPPRIRPPEAQQQALDTMMRQRGDLVMRPTAAGRDGFVDALLRSDPGSAQLRGRTLVLSVDTVSSRRCENAARLAQGYGGGIDTVLLAAGAAHAQCAVPAPARVAMADSTSDDRAALAHIRADARAAKLEIAALAISGSEATVYYRNGHYFSEREALDRLVRILMSDAPLEVERFRLVAMRDGLPQQAFQVLRGPEERSFIQTGALDLTSAAIDRDAAPMDDPVLAAATSTDYPRITWAVAPQLRQQWFERDDPFAVNLLATVSGKAELLPGLSLAGEAETSLYNNFHQDLPNTSTLPHVRSDFNRYFAQGKTGIGDLEADYRFRLAPDVYAVARGGLLESMFAGAGGEMLWRPQGQRWAIGIDGYEVWQRDFDRLFGLQPYHAFTGHLSLYYATPWYDLDVAVHAGRYLASDDGVTLEISRRFATGIEVGGYFTRTNVSASRFGEGAFDKGIFIRIPLGWALPLESQSELGLDLHPVDRDGGQRLSGDTTLFEETRRSSESEMQRGQL